MLKDRLKVVLALADIRRQARELLYAVHLIVLVQVLRVSIAFDQDLAHFIVLINLIRNLELVVPNHFRI